MNNTKANFKDAVLAQIEDARDEHRSALERFMAETPDAADLMTPAELAEQIEASFTPA